MPVATPEQRERENQPLLVRLPRDMHQAVKRQAEDEERTMAQVVRRALRAYLERERLS